VPRIAKKQRVREFAAARGWQRIGESEWNELRAALPDISAATMRQSGLPIGAPWCGVRQHTFEELEESLREFSATYEARPDLRKLCREMIIAAKDRAKLLAHKSNIDQKVRDRKAAMAEWMLIWLGDPAIFPVWVAAVKLTALKSQAEPDPHAPPETGPPPTPRCRPPVPSDS